MIGILAFLSVRETRTTLPRPRGAKCQIVWHSGCVESAAWSSVGRREWVGGAKNMTRDKTSLTPAPETQKFRRRLTAPPPPPRNQLESVEWTVPSLCSWKFWKIRDDFDVDGQLDSIAPPARSNPTARRRRNHLEFFKIFMNIVSRCRNVIRSYGAIRSTNGHLRIRRGIQPRWNIWTGWSSIRRLTWSTAWRTRWRRGCAAVVNYAVAQLIDVLLPLSTIDIDHVNDSAQSFRDPSGDPLTISKVSRPDCVTHFEASKGRFVWRVRAVTPRHSGGPWPARGSLWRPGGSPLWRPSGSLWRPGGSLSRGSNACGGTVPPWRRTHNVQQRARRSIQHQFGGWFSCQAVRCAPISSEELLNTRVPVSISSTTSHSFQRLFERLNKPLRLTVWSRWIGCGAKVRNSVAT